MFPRLTGIVLTAEAGGGIIEFARVEEVRLTSSELIIRGVRRRGSVIEAVAETVSFSREDIGALRVREGNSALSVFGWAAGIVTGLVLGIWVLVHA